MWSEGTNHETPLMTYLNLRLVYGRFASAFICLANLFNIKYNTRTMAPDKNSSSPTTFLKLIRDVFVNIHVAHLLLLLLIFMAVGIHKGCILAICWTVPCPI